MKSVDIEGRRIHAFKKFRQQKYNVRLERKNLKTLDHKSDAIYQDCFVRHRVVLENKAVYTTWN